MKSLVRKFNNHSELDEFVKRTKVKILREDKLFDGTVYLIYKK